MFEIVFAVVASVVLVMILSLWVYATKVRRSLVSSHHATTAPKDIASLYAEKRR